MEVDFWLIVYVQITRQKMALAEELLNARKEIERASDTTVRVSKEKEELTHEKAQLATELTAAERENRQQSEVIGSLKSDKDALETALYESQQLNAQLENRKEALEGENQELILKKENLMGKWTLVLTNTYQHSLKKISPGIVFIYLLALP